MEARRSQTSPAVPNMRFKSDSKPDVLVLMVLVHAGALPAYRRLLPSAIPESAL